MKVYLDQPTEGGVEADIKKQIEDSLKENLPDCLANEWFIESVHFANMIDTIMEEIRCIKSQ